MHYYLRVKENTINNCKVVLITRLLFYCYSLLITIQSVYCVKSESQVISCKGDLQLRLRQTAIVYLHYVTKFSLIHDIYPKISSFWLVLSITLVLDRFSVTLKFST